jgi:hypothetical protein
VWTPEEAGESAALASGSANAGWERNQDPVCHIVERRGWVDQPPRESLSHILQFIVKCLAVHLHIVALYSENG